MMAGLCLVGESILMVKLAAPLRRDASIRERKTDESERRVFNLIYREWHSAAIINWCRRLYVLKINERSHTHTHAHTLEAKRRIKKFLIWPQMDAIDRNIDSAHWYCHFSRQFSMYLSLAIRSATSKNCHYSGLSNFWTAVSCGFNHTNWRRCGKVKSSTFSLECWPFSRFISPKQ